LRHEAEEWGELKGRCLFARLTIRQGRYEMFDVDDALHENEPVAFVRTIRCRFSITPGA